MKTVIGILLVAGLLSACAGGNPQSNRGFRLPDGDAGAGRAAFIALNCSACHQVEGLEIPFEGKREASVKLGGEVGLVKTYGELVTSIINPSHRIAPGLPKDTLAPGGSSLMELAMLNEVMTVRQLIDLVTFLQSVYRVQPPQYNPYAYTYPM